MKLNTSGQPDGVLGGWVDGQLAFEKTDVPFRAVDKLKIEAVWINVYLGTWTAEQDHHLYLDEIVISKQPIGPLGRENLWGQRLRSGSLRSPALRRCPHRRMPEPGRCQSL